MLPTHFETTEISLQNSERSVRADSSASRRSAFTLTELLVVITIIAILAGLITGAALNALNKAKQAAITLELQELARGMEDFNNEFSIYPPNVFAASLVSAQDQTENLETLVRAMKKISSRSTEFQINTPFDEPNNNLTTILANGLSPSEAVVFWLQGFSADIARPLTGTDLNFTAIEYTNPVTSSVETPNNVVTIDSRQSRFEFDRNRLKLSFDRATGDRRYMVMQRADGTEVQIQLYEYFPKSSTQPYVYFDVSRETPEQAINNWNTTEFFYTNSTAGGVIYPLKQLKPNTPTDTSARAVPWIQYVEYVEQGKFQLLHAGIDDAWGDFSNATGMQGELDVTTTNNQYIPALLAPEGPFIGDVADTLGNFMPGTLEDKQE